MNEKFVPFRTLLNATCRRSIIMLVDLIAVIIFRKQAFRVFAKSFFHHYEFLNSQFH